MATPILTVDVESTPRLTNAELQAAVQCAVPALHAGQKNGGASQPASRGAGSSMQMILAKNHREAERHATLRDIPPEKWAYIARASSLRGRRKAHVVRVGKWYSRDDLDEVEAMIKMQQCTVGDA